MKSTAFVHRFQSLPAQLELPERFTFPFYYEPHELAAQASKEIQEKYLEKNPWRHNFGLDPSIDGMVIGKMFGVLVVQDEAGELGYLSAFSGKLADANHHEGFVPPVFDILKNDGFYKIEEAEVNELNRELDDLEKSGKREELKQQLQQIKANAAEKIEAYKRFCKEAKSARDTQRNEAKSKLPETELLALEQELKNESTAHSYQLKLLRADMQHAIQEIESALQEVENEIAQVKEKRKLRSAALQGKIFDAYYFLDAEKQEKSLLQIFQDFGIDLPPAGAGECAAPKLLQFAYLHKLKPIAFAEFWWGASPKSEVRAHGNFYPSCRGKCEPILKHMLNGLEVDPNPMLLNPADGKELTIVYEDDSIIIIDKPAEFLSVPGKNIQDSVLYRLQQLYPEASGPILVHRLDMSTSGLLVAAKTEEAHAFIQRQFIQRKVGKRYSAILSGIPKEAEGTIELPLRVDLDNRPFQMVCFEHGKAARTQFVVQATHEGKALVHFYPLTGRTHQLRVHAAHSSGLNTPIVGDDLYGKRSDRLYLHASRLHFIHPSTKKKFTIKSIPDFEKNFGI